MTITQNGTNDVYDKNGLVSSTPVVIDITTTVNLQTLLTQAQNAITTNQTALAQPDPTPGNTTYLGIGSPTNAQVVAQVRALTQQNNVIIPQLLAVTQQNNKIIRLLLTLLNVPGLLADTT